MERYQARSEQELNKRFREEIGALTDGTRICSNEEAARLVRGDNSVNAELVKNQRNKMEKATAV